MILQQIVACFNTYKTGLNLNSLPQLFFPLLYRKILLPNSSKDDLEIIFSKPAKEISVGAKNIYIFLGQKNPEFSYFYFIIRSKVYLFLQRRSLRRSQRRPRWLINPKRHDCQKGKKPRRIYKE